MSSIEERERNLFNATDTLAQFYDEIESFMDLLYSSMGKLGFTSKAERLRSGTFTIHNLPRRLVALATVINGKSVGAVEEAGEDEGIQEESDDENGAQEKAGKELLDITEGLRIPFVTLYLFQPKSIPTVQTLESPRLLLGAIGGFRFMDKKTGQLATPDSPSLSLNNLAQVPISPKSKVGDPVQLDCWPKAMRRYKMHAKLVGFENRRLLEIDSQEKVRDIAEKLNTFCQGNHVERAAL